MRDIVQSVLQKMGNGLIAVMDASFSAKSGKKTFGLDWFYRGCHSRTERGLEVSVIAVVG